MKTAVEFAVEKLEKFIPSGNQIAIECILEQSKEMEKERLEDAYRTGIWDVGCRSISFEEYYNRTFKQQQEQ
jgi:hypothetical protein